MRRRSTTIQQVGRIVIINPGQSQGKSGKPDTEDYTAVLWFMLSCPLIFVAGLVVMHYFNLLS